MEKKRERESQGRALYLSNSVSVKIVNTACIFSWGGPLVRNGKSFESGKTKKSLDASADFILHKYLAQS